MASGLRRRAVVAPAAIALVAGGGAVAWGSSGGGGAGYRTAVVGRSDVQQLLTLTGTVSVAQQAKARFRASGTVRSVLATVGQPVTKGQVLATMDTGSLQDAVTRAKASLAKAAAALETDSLSSTPSPTSSATSTASSSAVAVNPLAAAQRAADRALQQASRALAQATATCTETVAPTPAATPTSSPAARGADGQAGSCTTALADALHAQQVSAQAQQALAGILQGSSKTSANPAPTTTSSPVPSDRDQGSSTTTSSAARLTTDTAVVSAAQVALTEAQENLSAVTLRAPISGTIASIPWAAGQTAAVGDAVVVLGAGAVDVTVDVPASSIRSVRVGLPATVRADGASKAVTGVVTRVGLLPSGTSSSGSSSTSYPVIVRVTASGLVQGGAASVGIVVKTVKDVITVPNSALHGVSVDVLSKGKVTSVPVKTGAVGALLTQVTSGLTAGQTVVLADLGDALPTSSTTSNRPDFGGGFNVPAGGFSGPPGGSGGGPVVVKGTG